MLVSVGPWRPQATREILGASSYLTPDSLEHLDYYRDGPQRRNQVFIGPHISAGGGDVQMPRNYKPKIKESSIGMAVFSPSKFTDNQDKTDLKHHLCKRP